MIYLVKDIIEKYEVSDIKLNDFFNDNSISIQNDSITEKSFQLFIDFYENGEKNKTNGTSKHKENQDKIENTNNGKLSYLSEDERVYIVQDDAISFLKKQPDNSVDIIVTDPAYSGMNQMLKLGRDKIIGKYVDKGDGQKWFSNNIKIQ